MLIFFGVIKLLTLFVQEIGAYPPKVISCAFSDSPWQGLGVHRETSFSRVDP